METASASSAGGGGGGQNGHGEEFVGGPAGSGGRGCGRTASRRAGSTGCSSRWSLIPWFRSRTVAYRWSVKRGIADAAGPASLAVVVSLGVEAAEAAVDEEVIQIGGPEFFGDAVDRVALADRSEVEADTRLSEGDGAGRRRCRAAAPGGPVPVQVRASSISVWVGMRLFLRGSAARAHQFAGRWDRGHRRSAARGRRVALEQVEQAFLDDGAVGGLLVEVGRLRCRRGRRWSCCSRMWTEVEGVGGRHHRLREDGVEDDAPGAGGARVSRRMVAPASGGDRSVRWSASWFPACSTCRRAERPVRNSRREEAGSGHRGD